MSTDCLKLEGWHLVNGVARNKDNPTFEIPSYDERISQMIGENVKLGFELDVPDAQSGFTGERMWVCIDEVISVKQSLIDTLYYRGRLLNTSIYDAYYLSAGIRIEFGPEHILAIEF